ncbi:MAG TPA: hypothetical protein VNL39_01805 [Xanthobacteraceae bacterium]|nr:hypothetical protein [Xanthobacteraceae bacterium]
MPELIILISAVVCAAAAIVLYYNRSSAIAAGATVLGFIAFLYGIGQHIERDNPETRVPSFGDLASQRTANKPSPAPEETPKPPQASAEARTEREKLDAIGTSARQTAAIDAIQPAPPSAGVVISHFIAERIPPRDIVVSATLVNNNPFPVKNIVLRCGDRSYATGDVTGLVDKVVPPRSNLRVTALRMGPIRPELPPTICLVDKFDRAD